MVGGRDSEEKMALDHFPEIVGNCAPRKVKYQDPVKKAVKLKSYYVIIWNDFISMLLSPYRQVRHRNIPLSITPMTKRIGAINPLFEFIVHS